ncbi:M1 family aminopeptidase [Hymenobacter wooponensis]|uniref:Peptidase M1 membrane alanine aminopeptidase domain-containing protein n=1 Tax=Hymenobacter wooponensis TaxID=1525360 RepID=A0A4Z0MQQ4_9BACT|nr:M1 family aminopeptidase [Hymenobacter wooponensis]TGD82262.1 hypothetical protein EU557_00275 [Hymenobacter wooponensis]
MKYLLVLITIIAFCSPFTSLASPNQAHIEVKLEPAKKQFWCRYTLTVPADAAESSVQLYLNKAFTILELKSAGAVQKKVSPVLYSLAQDTVQAIQLTYSPSKHRRQVVVTYRGTLPPKYASPEVMELSGHSNWLPTRPFQEYELIDYVLEAEAPASYHIISSSPPTRHTKTQSTFRGRTSAIEPTVIAAQHMYQASTGTQIPVHVFKAATPLQHADSLLLTETEQVVAYYNGSIGKQDPIQRFSILLTGFDRDAFGLLDNATVITYPDYDIRKRTDRLTLAHEISHKWWAYGSFSDYNDWLNEAFATYSSLLYLRATADTAGYRQELAKRVASAAGAPAIIGFIKAEHSYPMYRRVIYDKGTTVLAALHARLGDAPFLAILATTAARKTTTTQEFLTIVEQAAGLDTRQWLEKLLTT